MSDETQRFTIELTRDELTILRSIVIIPGAGWHERSYVTLSLLAQKLFKLTWIEASK